jgi:hypothetical protein
MKYRCQHIGPWSNMVDKAADRLFRSFRGKAPSLHALTRFDQRLVEGIDSDKPQTRIFDIENDVHRRR